MPRFFFAMYSHRLPSSVTSVYLYIGVLYSLSMTQIASITAHKMKYATDEPMDLLTDEMIEQSDEYGRVEEWDLIDPNDLAVAPDVVGENVPDNFPRSKSFVKQKSRMDFNEMMQGERKSRANISEYIRSMTDGRTKYVTRMIERKQLVEKFVV